MTHRHVVVVACLVLALLAAPSIVAQEAPTATETATATQADTTNTTNATDESAGMGTQMTAFLQSSSTAANDSVENGMWEARFDQSNASERARLVTDRTGSLDQRLERLEAQNESVQQRYENGTLTEQAYIARQSQLNARIDALRTAVNDTDEAARETGVNDSRLERLKRNASQLRGQRVAGVARGLGAGPPDHAGPPSDRGAGAGPPGDTGPPSDRGADAGPPSDRGTPDGPARNSTSDSTSDDPGAESGDESGDDDSDGGSGNAGSGNSGGSGNAGGGPP
jgi:hypothetical protein